MTVAVHVCMTLTLILLQDDDDEGGAAARDKSHIVEQFTGVGIKVRMKNTMCVLHYHHTLFHFIAQSFVLLID